LMAESLEAAQKQKKISIPANHKRIIEQSRLALQMGVQASAELHRRVAESFEALGKPDEALSNYRQAISIDPTLGLPIDKKIIRLQIEQGELGAAEAALASYLQSPQITDTERAWAIGQQAKLLIDVGRMSDASRKLEEAVQLEMDAVALGELNYWLGYVAWNQKNDADAERYLRLARDQLQIRHPLDAEASLLLGQIFQYRREPDVAISFYDVVLTSHPDSPAAVPAMLGRGGSRLLAGNHAGGLSDLQNAVAAIGRRESRERFVQQ